LVGCHAVCLQFETTDTQVKDAWGCAGTVADMRMVSATCALLQNAPTDFENVPHLWTGILAGSLLV
jgi:hypothetical protein